MQRCVRSVEKNYGCHWGLLMDRVYLSQYEKVKKREDGSPKRRIHSVNGYGMNSADSIRHAYFVLWGAFN